MSPYGAVERMRRSTFPRPRPFTLSALIPSRFGGGVRTSRHAMAHGTGVGALTMPWKDSFPAIYPLCGMDVVEAWPELHVLKGTEP
jgi:hypothetical protein